MRTSQSLWTVGAALIGLLSSIPSDAAIVFMSAQVNSGTYLNFDGELSSDTDTQTAFPNLISSIVAESYIARSVGALTGGGTASSRLTLNTAGSGEFDMTTSAEATIPNNSAGVQIRSVVGDNRYSFVVTDSLIMDFSYTVSGASMVFNGIDYSTVNPLIFLSIGSISSLLSVSGFTSVALGPGSYTISTYLDDPTSSTSGSFLSAVGNAGNYSATASGSLAFEVRGVPEPTTWAMFIGGFGLIGGAMRRRNKVSVAFA